MSDENKNLNLEKEDNKIKPEANAISDEDLENVGGGAIFYAGRYAGDRDHKWEVLDDETGDVVSRWGTKKDALKAARRAGESNERYYRMSTVEKKRDSYRQWEKYKDKDKYVNPY